MCAETVTACRRSSNRKAFARNRNAVTVVFVGAAVPFDAVRNEDVNPVKQ